LRCCAKRQAYRSKSQTADEMKREIGGTLSLC
jgi:hypothetical protein